MKLAEAEILQLLPTFMHDDYFVRMLAAVTSETTAYLGYAVTLATKWDKIDEMDGEFLDALAAELDIDWYLYDTDIDRKRAIIKDSCYIHSIFGTREAVQRVLNTYFGEYNDETGTYESDVVIKEWWEPGFEDDFGTIGYFKPLDVDGTQENNGNCYCFAVTAPEAGLAHGTVEQLFEVVKKVKNVRSHLTWGYTKYGVKAAVVARGFVCAISGEGAYLCSDTLKCSSSVLASGTFSGECVNVFGPDTPTPPTPTGNVTIHVQDTYTGNPIEGATVTITQSGSGGNSVFVLGDSDATTDVSGNASFDLEAGTYTVSAMANDHIDKSVSVVVGDTEMTETVSLDGLGYITGVVTIDGSPAAGALMTLKSQNGEYVYGSALSSTGGNYYLNYLQINTGSALNVVKATYASAFGIEIASETKTIPSYTHSSQTLNFDLHSD